MEQKLTALQDEYERMLQELADPNISGNHVEVTKRNKRIRQLEPIISLWRALQTVRGDIDVAEELLGESGTEDMEDTKAELRTLKDKRAEIEESLKLALVPTDPNDQKDVIIEIRAGAGGDEAGLFATELLRAYLRFAEKEGFTAEMLSVSEGALGALKEGIIEICGDGAYSVFKYESGVHRVQRVPVTESSGRIHTSTITVAVLPEAEEVELEIKPTDLRIDVFRSSGHGGQSVNTTDSAVRITHLPTGLAVSCQDEKSQLKNKIQAMKILRSRLLAMEQERLFKERGDARRDQIGSGDRSEKIRTYNFPQDRLTDHRLQRNWSGLPSIMNGELHDIITALRTEDQARRLSSASK